MKEKLVLYLAGHVPEYEYRTYCIKKYGDDYDLFDPISMVPEDQSIKIIVEEDKVAIRKSDILIAFIEKASFGTGMEIPFAFELDIPVLIVNPNGKFMHDTWLVYHSEKMFRSLDECFSYIKETYVE